MNLKSHKQFFLSQKEWHSNLEGFNVSLFWQFLAIFYYFYFSVKWNLRRVTLIWRKNKTDYFILFWSVELSILSYLYKFKCLQREWNATMLLLWIPTEVEGEYEVSVFAKMTLCSIHVLQSVVWKTIQKFFLVHNQDLVYRVLITSIL